MNTRNTFLFASFLSSLGSLTFAIANLGFMSQAGFGLMSIGLVVFFSRVCSLVVQLAFSGAIENAKPSDTLVKTELWGAFVSMGLLIVWNADPKGYFWIFLTLISLRAVLMALQNPLRAKIVRIASESNNGSEGRFLIWLNKATYGSTFLAGLIGFLSIKYLTLSHVIVFDFFTYLVSGIIIYFLQKNLAVSGSSIAKNSKLKIKDYFKLNPKIIAQDYFLAAIFSGANIMTVRLAFGNNDLVPIYVGMFGFSVWISGFMLRSKISRLPNSFWWLSLFVSLGVLCACSKWNHSGLAIFLPLSFSYIIYWVLFHKFTVGIQKAASNDIVLQVAAIRIAVTTILLSIGELIPGILGDGSYSVVTDLLARLSLALFALIYSLKNSSTDDLSSEYNF